jgi:alkylhydroperoxidase family enzyme
LGFARALLETGGHVPEAQCTAARSVGLTEAALVEITAVVGHTAFANLVNNLGSR